MSGWLAIGLIVIGLLVVALAVLGFDISRGDVGGGRHTMARARTHWAERRAPRTLAAVCGPRSSRTTRPAGSRIAVVGSPLRP